MFKINRKIEYALISLKYLSNLKPGELASAKDICSQFQIPFDPTSRVLQIMAKNQLLRSEQGISGGYQITKDLHKISFLEFSEVLMGKTALAKCLSGRNCIIAHRCNISTPVSKLNHQVTTLLKGISVGDLLDSQPTRLNKEVTAHG